MTNQTRVYSKSPPARADRLTKEQVQEIRGQVMSGRADATAARLLGLILRKRALEKAPFAAHELIERGLPASALIGLLGKLHTMDKNPVLKALGMSERTYQRHKETAKPLSADQSGRTWKFAEILAKATEVFGSQERAEQWLEQPAISLEQRRPIDLLTTPAGTEIVETFLGRLEYGVYT
jgi:putative toxin-antitoxin system antitoxin component (TIGR02293 family)